MTCELCGAAGGRIVWQDADWRVVRVEGGDGDAFPGFYRVVSQAHVVEFGDLSVGQRSRCMALVVAVERALRKRLAPRKINLAALGNVVAHLHWHVVARFEWDSRFPQPIWAPAQRTVTPPATERLAQSIAGLDGAIVQALEEAD